MMISRGLGFYPDGFPTTPFTTIGGRSVTDPGAESPTAEDCLPYICGANPGETLPRLWCAFHGRSGALACNAPQCAPYKPYIPDCSLPQVPAAAPSLPPPPPPQIPVLTPANIVQPIPDITETVAPHAYPVPSCSLWCVLNGAITDHPLIAVALLVGVAALAWPRKR